MRRRGLGGVYIRESNQEPVGEAQKETAEVEHAGRGGADLDCAGDCVDEACEPEGLSAAEICCEEAGDERGDEGAER